MLFELYGLMLLWLYIYIYSNMNLLEAVRSGTQDNAVVEESVVEEAMQFSESRGLYIYIVYYIHTYIHKSVHIYIYISIVVLS